MTLTGVSNKIENTISTSNIEPVKEYKMFSRIGETLNLQSGNGSQFQVLCNILTIDLQGTKGDLFNIEERFDMYQKTYKLEKKNKKTKKVKTRKPIHKKKKSSGTLNPHKGIPRFKRKRKKK